MVDMKRFDDYCLLKNIQVTEENKKRLVDLFFSGRTDLMSAVSNGMYNRAQRRGK